MPFFHLYDDDRLLWGHGLPTPSRYSVHVPLFIWTSRSYEDAYPRQLGHLASRLDAKIGLESLFHTLPDMAGITFEAQEPSRDLAGPDFRERPRYILTVTNELRNVSALR